MPTVCGFSYKSGIDDKPRDSSVQVLRPLPGSSGGQAAGGTAFSSERGGAGFQWQKQVEQGRLWRGLGLGQRLSLSDTRLWH